MEITALKIDSQPLEDHQVQLNVEFDSGMLDNYKHRAARDLAQRIKIPGFRPGKAPYNIVVRHVGEPALLEEALDRLVNDQYEKVIEESGIHPYGAGQLERIVSSEPLVLEFIVPLEPEVQLGDYLSIKKAYEPKEITDEDVNRVLDDLRDRQAILEPAERPAEIGDVVTVHLAGKRLNPEEGESTDLIEENSYQLLVRSNDDAAKDEWPYPGFSHELVAMYIGDTKSLTYTFPDDHDFESLRGVGAEYDVNVEEIKSRTLPELDDKFAKTVGETYENLDSLKDDIRTSLERQNQESYDEDYDDSILSELVDQSTIKYPPQMLESEQNNVVESFTRRLEQQGSDLDLYLKTRDMTVDDLKEEAKPVAEQRLKRSLALLELTKAEDIQVSEEELQNQTTNLLRSLNQSLSPEDSRRLGDQRIMNNLVGNVMLDLLNQRALQLLREIAQGKYPPEEQTETEPVAEDAVKQTTDTTDASSESQDESEIPAEAEEQVIQPSMDDEEVIETTETEE